MYCDLCWCSSLLLASVITPWPKAMRGSKGFVWLTLPCHISSLRGVRTRSHAGTWKVGTKAETIEVEHCFLLGLESATFLTEPRLTLPRWHQPQWAGPSDIQFTIKKMPHGYAYSPVWWRKFLNWGSLFTGVWSWQPKLAITADAVPLTIALVFHLFFNFLVVGRRDYKWMSKEFNVHVTLITFISSYLICLFILNVFIRLLENPTWLWWESLED